MRIVILIYVLFFTGSAFGQWNIRGWDNDSLKYSFQNFKPQIKKGGATLFQFGAQWVPYSDGSLFLFNYLNGRSLYKEKNKISSKVIGRTFAKDTMQVIMSVNLQADTLGIFLITQNWTKTPSGDSFPLLSFYYRTASSNWLIQKEILLDSFRLISSIKVPPMFQINVEFHIYNTIAEVSQPGFVKLIMRDTLYGVINDYLILYLSPEKVKITKEINKMFQYFNLGFSGFFKQSEDRKGMFYFPANKIRLPNNHEFVSFLNYYLPYISIDSFGHPIPLDSFYFEYNPNGNNWFYVRNDWIKLSDSIMYQLLALDTLAYNDSIRSGTHRPYTLRRIYLPTMKIDTLFHAHHAFDIEKKLQVNRMALYNVFTTPSGQIILASRGKGKSWFIPTPEAYPPPNKTLKPLFPLFDTVGVGIDSVKWPYPYTSNGSDYPTFTLRFKINTNCRGYSLIPSGNLQGLQVKSWIIYKGTPEKYSIDSVQGDRLFLGIQDSNVFFVQIHAVTEGGFHLWAGDYVEPTFFPNAAFSTQSQLGCEHVAVQFTDKSTNPNKIPVSYHWQWGDGTDTIIHVQDTSWFSGIGSCSHTYRQNGNFSVKLTLLYGICRDSVNQVMQIQIQEAPDPAFSIPDTTCQNQKVTAAWKQPQDSITQAQISWGDGTDTLVFTQNQMLSQIQFSHGYAQTGRYEVVSRLASKTGCITWDTQYIYVSKRLNNADRPYLRLVTFNERRDSIMARVNPIEGARSYHWMPVNKKTPGPEIWLPSHDNVDSISVNGEDYCSHSSGASRYLAIPKIYVSNQSTDWLPQIQSVHYPNEFSWGLYRRNANAWEEISPNFSLFTDSLHYMKTLQELDYNSEYTLIGLNAEKDTFYSNILKIVPTPIQWIPNAFSPNHDLINDYFKPTIHLRGPYKISIYDRYGRLVYQGHEKDGGWDGTFKGKEMPTGVYVYYIQLQHDTLKGAIHLLK